MASVVATKLSKQGDCKHCKGKTDVHVFLTEPPEPDRLVAIIDCRKCNRALEHSMLIDLNLQETK